MPNKNTAALAPHCNLVGSSAAKTFNPQLERQIVGYQLNAIHGVMS